MTADLFWARPSTNVVVREDEVHVWRASLDQPGDYIHELRHTLAVGERERAARYHFDEDREAFVVARGLLRKILGRYLGVAPSEVRFSYNSYGKPALEQAGRRAVRFNLSHSGQVVLYAVARGRNVGVDVERIRPVPRAEQIVNRYFSARERVFLSALPADQRQGAFFSCWTRKEAYIKARGQGLSLSFDEFDVPLGPEEPMTITHAEERFQGGASWSLRELHVGDGYAAALAVEGECRHLQGWQWCE
jgi:4'-phosphopantetheinyl transferase